ncbi:beta strand repeat-containing protein, partial [Stratiformator vulcanicus]|uniref:beta strand repeat-containing protein n=1 Tax=Stratiformator vulcanicus TaxID=2527980 RepID=UPI002877460C
MLNASAVLPVLSDSGDGATTDGSVSVDDVGGMTVTAGSGMDDGFADSFEVSRAGDDLHVYLNGNQIFEGDADGITSIDVIGSGDADTLTVDLGDGPFDGEISFDGNEGQDILEVRASDVESVSHSLADDASVINVESADIDAAVTYDDVEAVIDSTDAKSQTIDGSRLSSLSVGTNGSGSTLVSTGDLQLELTRIADELAIDTTGGSPDGTDVTIDSLNSPGTDVSISGDANDAVEFRGSTTLESGDLYASSGDVLIDGGLISDGGTLDVAATGDMTILKNSQIESREGAIFLEAGSTLTIDGSVDASSTSGTGGEVHLLGSHVELKADASINADGLLGGGTILVGGDYQGANADVRNAETTLIEAGAELTADAILNGDGGKIVVWADGTTYYAGHISARGGSASGDGGFAEVSGKGRLGYFGTADLGAVNGQTGDLLLDPENITVGNFVGGLDPNLFFENPNGGTSTVDVGLINSAVANVTLQATNNIFFNQAINITAAGVGISAQAGNNIFVDASIVTNGGSVLLEADSAASPTGGDDGSGDLVVRDFIQSGAGNITLSGNTVRIDSGVGVFADTGDVTADGNTIILGGIGSSSGTTTFRDGVVSGDGIVIGDTVIAAGGTLTAGNSLGTLIVNGDLTFESDSTFLVEIDDQQAVGTTPGAGGTHDRVFVSVDVTIDPNVVFTVDFEPGGDAETNLNDAYHFLTANSITGEFANAPENGILTGDFFADGDVEAGERSAVASYTNGDFVVTINPPPPPIVVDALGDVSDGDFSAGNFTLREAIELAELDNNPVTIQFDPALVAAGDATIFINQFDTGLDPGEAGRTAFQITTDITIEGPSGENGIVIQRQDGAAFR